MENLCDDMQFAYKQNRCVDDAVTTMIPMIHVLCAHLDKCKTYSRVLFVDVSSSFKGALYRIWCGVNRLGDSGVKVV